MSSHERSYERFYEVVRRIPSGRVATYGAVAAEAGLPGRARQVGYALAALRDGKADTVPWHRVVNARGAISERTAGHGVERLQRALLEAEGVVFDARGRLDLDRYGWP
ncbi:MAG TPA: MGMT family protein [Longimicrobiales bacterium]|nr:MGMT family protein [Longimicrobiales bacterium]